MGLIRVASASRPLSISKALSSSSKRHYLARLLLCFSLGWPLPPLHAQEASLPQTGIGKEIFMLLESKQHPYLVQTGFAGRAEDMQALYKAANYEPVWLNRNDAEVLITETLDLLSNAASEGLNPQHYDAGKLKEMLPATLQLPPVAVRKRAMFDTAVSLSLLRYLHDLHYGRVSPQDINFNLKLREKKLIDLPALILSALDRSRITPLPAEVEPKLDQYRKLKPALAHYRELAARVVPLKLDVARSVHIGDKHPQLEELRRFLVQTGEIQAGADNTQTPTDPVYDKELSEGVKRFQARHGLTADGVLGRGTAAALSVPLSERVTQIELALERLRWLPEIGTGPYILVNIPAFQMWVYDDISKSEPSPLSMRVVVGQAMKTQTPVLMAEMKFIDFMPYWNVPYSITKNEIIPKLIANPAYLHSENLEIVTAFSDQAKPVPLNVDSLLMLKQGLLKIRQRPGKKNPLGKVKFMFPNKDDVYLHDTPSKSLFNRSTRDFSHGCVRIERPQDLAEFALRNQPEWTKENIQLAMQAPKMQRVMLKRSIPILFFYTTSFVEQNGEVAFYRDIYGHDTVLLETLKNSSDLSDQLLFVSQGTAPPTRSTERRLSDPSGSVGI
ncbi:L,D-transpeptidase family protein [Methylomicrobium sp. RS1]|uniref:L,D-transpeptidase family protein n=1 Tax=Candidatus Methylomicrobium oryzae TaxID=2802053 RepID=UPI0019245698|nr:L,D-transpeptidase family protein [Methylomicrobium sp. RS1]MBL1265313.1 L,D-transpeptidase family protein [Methylomicrobium sp. RS1]